MHKKALEKHNKQLTTSTNQTEFKPTPHMILWLNTAAQYMPETVTEVARLCGLDRTNWYKWIELDGFTDWYFEAYAKARRGIIPTLDSIGMRYAKKGSYPHWKDMNKKAGENLDEPTGIVNNVTIPILQGMSKQPQEYKEVEIIEEPEVQELIGEVDDLLPTEEPTSGVKWQPKNLSGFTRPSFS